ncbi:transposase [Bradyrhizobium sp. 157]|nr:transposase [Bradyrhizobium sp. 157]
MVEETVQAGETVCGVARRHGVAPSLLFTWPARQGRPGGDAVPALVPVEITPAPGRYRSARRNRCFHRLRSDTGRPCHSVLLRTACVHCAMLG